MSALPGPEQNTSRMFMLDKYVLWTISVERVLMTAECGVREFLGMKA